MNNVKKRTLNKNVKTKKNNIDIYEIISIILNSNIFAILFHLALFCACVYFMSLFDLSNPYAPNNSISNSKFWSSFFVGALVYMGIVYIPQGIRFFINEFKEDKDDYIDEDDNY